MRRIQRGLTEDQLLEQQIEAARERRFLKAMALKSQIGLTDDERHSLAQMLPGVDKDSGGSWKELNPKQLHDLICMLDGYLLIRELISQRPPVIPTLGTYAAGQTYTTGTYTTSHTHAIPPYTFTKVHE